MGVTCSGKGFPEDGTPELRGDGEPLPEGRPRWGRGGHCSGERGVCEVADPATLGVSVRLGRGRVRISLKRLLTDHKAFGAHTFRCKLDVSWAS